MAAKKTKKSAGKKTARKKKSSVKAAAEASQAKRKKKIRKLEKLDKVTVDQIDSTAKLVYTKVNKLSKPEMKFPVRSLSNVRYDKRKGYFLAGKEFSLVDEEIYTLPLPVPSDFWTVDTRKEDRKPCPVNP